MDLQKESGSFSTAPGFCPDCGTILPLCTDVGRVTCYACERKWDPEEGLYFEVSSVSLFLFSFYFLFF